MHQYKRSYIKILNLQETNFKIFSQWYRTPSFLHRCFLNTSDFCWHCQGECGTLLHLLVLFQNREFVEKGPEDHPKML